MRNMWLITLIITILMIANLAVGGGDTSKITEETLGEWNKTFGGSGPDEGSSVQQTLDGGYIIAGWSYGDNGSVLLIKTDDNGNKLWDKTFGGSEDDSGSSVQQTLDGGYIIAGWTGSYGEGNMDALLIKTDDKGNKLWDKTFGGSNLDVGDSVHQALDGGYIITGYNKSYKDGNMDVWLIKTDDKGNKLWDKTFGGSGPDEGSSVRQTLDGGYIIAGWTGSYGDNIDLWLIKIGDKGNKLWDKTFGGSEDDAGLSVQQTLDGGYIVTGWTESYGEGNMDALLIKTDDKGNKIWDKTFGGSEDDSGTSVQQTLDGGYIVTGWTESYGEGIRDIWLIKIDDKGNKLWDKTFGGSDYDEGLSVQQTFDGGYIVTGWTKSYGDNIDVWLIKTDSEGNV